MRLFDPLDEFYKSVRGAVREGEELVFRVCSDSNCCALKIREDGSDVVSTFDMEKDGGTFSRTISLKKGLYFYCFDLKNGKMIGNVDYFGVVGKDLPPFQLTVYDKDFNTPDYIKGEIIYQIFPDRFCRSTDNKSVENGKVFHKDVHDTPVFLPDEYGEVKNNDFFGGDLQGIIEKLDYLKSLNVGVIYLNPIFKAYSNHRYDTGDYFEIDPLLGTQKDFEELISVAAEKGIKIILDGVFNHTGSDSVYFDIDDKYGNGAYHHRDSAYRKWFKINHRNVYESWWGIKTLPATDKHCKEYINFITGENGVIDYYTKKGIGGWRLDVVDELPESFVKKIRERVKSVDKNAVIIGEVWEDASNKIAYGVRRRYFQGGELDSVMNYPLKNAIISYVKDKKVDNLLSVVKTQLDHYPKQCLDSLMNILATHDTFRLLSVLSSENVWGKSKLEIAHLRISDKEMPECVFKLKAATLLQFTLFGVPSIYYGDEIGMQGYSDPLNRKYFEWDNINSDILEWYKKISEIRSGLEVFKKGDVSIIFAKGGIFVFERRNESSGAIIAVNTSEISETLTFNGKLKDLISGEYYSDEYVIKPYSLAVLINEGRAVNG